MTVIENISEKVKTLHEKYEFNVNTLSELLGIDVSSGNEVSNYDTHSGNGDGTSCIALSFNDDTVLEKIKNNTEWSSFPLDETVQTLVYGMETETTKDGPFLTDENGKPLVPEIQNGYYCLIDRHSHTNLLKEENPFERIYCDFRKRIFLNKKWIQRGREKSLG